MHGFERSRQKNIEVSEISYNFLRVAPIHSFEVGTDCHVSREKRRKRERKGEKKKTERKEGRLKESLGKGSSLSILLLRHSSFFYFLNQLRNYPGLSSSSCSFMARLQLYRQIFWKYHNITRILVIFSISASYWNHCQISSQYQPIWFHIDGCSPLSAVIFNHGHKDQIKVVWSYFIQNHFCRIIGQMRYKLQWLVNCRNFQFHTSIFSLYLFKCLKRREDFKK